MREFWKDTGIHIWPVGVTGQFTVLPFWLRHRRGVKRGEVGVNPQSMVSIYELSNPVSAKSDTLCWFLLMRKCCKMLFFWGGHPGCAKKVILSADGGCRSCSCLLPETKHPHTHTNILKYTTVWLHSCFLATVPVCERTVVYRLQTQTVAKDL